MEMDTPPPPPVQVERHGAVTLLRLNRPDTRNALSAELTAALHAELLRAASDPDVRCLVLAGTTLADGRRVFSAGADLREMRAMLDAPPEQARLDAGRLAELLHLIHEGPLPVVAAVEGAAVAGGAGLASACDLVVAGQGARLGYSEVRLGFVAAIVMVFLLRCVGEKHARELLLTGRLVTAQEAWRIGLLNEVVPDGTAEERALELAHEVAGHSRAAVRSTRELLGLLPGLELGEGLRRAADANAQARTTDDFREGVTAFLEKRPPRWP